MWSQGKCGHPHKKRVGYSPSFSLRERRGEAWTTKTQPEAGVGENFSSWGQAFDEPASGLRTKRKEVDFSKKWNFFENFLCGRQLDILIKGWVLGVRLPMFSYWLLQAKYFSKPLGEETNLETGSRKGALLWGRQREPLT